MTAWALAAVIAALVVTGCGASQHPPVPASRSASPSPAITALSGLELRTDMVNCRRPAPG
jgi:hypothetical protein